MITSKLHLVVVIIKALDSYTQGPKHQRLSQFLTENIGGFYYHFIF